MNSIDTTRSSLIPKDSKAAQSTSAGKAGKASKAAANATKAHQEVGKTKTANHAKVDIKDSIKDFSQIKRAADNAPDIDNSEKIAALKAKIQGGQYKVDPDALAAKLLEQ